MRNLLKYIFGIYKTLKWFFQREKDKKIILSFRKRFFCWFKGFLSESFIIYDFSKNSSDEFVSDWVRKTVLNRVNQNPSEFDDKLEFAIRYKEELNIVIPLGLVLGGKIVDPFSFKGVSFDKRFFNENLIFKPRFGGGGLGVEKISLKNLFTEELKLKPDAIEYEGGLIYEVFRQDGFFNKVFPKSLNTIRVLTYCNEKGEGQIVTAIARFGTMNSGVVDNWSSGGISVGIEINNGVLLKGAVFPDSGNINWLATHPDTEVKFEGVKVPQWKPVVEFLMEKAKAYPMNPYLGWDIVVNNNSFKVLEINTNSDLNLLQIHGGLKNHPAFKEILDRTK